jgi:hypothetical protein
MPSRLARRAFFVCALAFSLCSINNLAEAQADAAWPHAITVSGASVVVYQPQAISWPDHETLTTREAIAITPPGEKAPVLGTTEISFSTRTDAATGQVVLSNPQLQASHFPALDTEQATRIEQQIKGALPDIHPRPVPLAAILLSLKEQAQPDNIAVSNDPPDILYSARPASLVVLDGEPVLAPIGQTGLSAVVNINWEALAEARQLR